MTDSLKWNWATQNSRIGKRSTIEWLKYFQQLNYAAYEMRLRHSLGVRGVEEMTNAMALNWGAGVWATEQFDIILGKGVGPGHAGLSKGVEEMPDAMTFNERFTSKFRADIHTVFYNWVETDLGGDSKFYDDPFEPQRLKAIGHALENILNLSVKLIMEDVNYFIKQGRSTTAADSSDMALLMAKVQNLEQDKLDAILANNALHARLERLEAQKALGGKPIDLGGGFVVDPETYDKMKHPHKHTKEYPWPL